MYASRTALRYEPLHDVDPVSLAPFLEFMRDKFGTVVAADNVRLALLPYDFFHEADYSFCGHRWRNLLRNGHTVAVVDDVEYAELSVALQHVSYEVYGPCDVFPFRCIQRVLHSILDIHQ